MVSVVVLVCITLIINDAEHFFTCLLTMCFSEMSSNLLSF